MSEKHIAKKNADRVAPLRVGGGLVAAEFRAIDDVVVNERGDVDEFQNDGEIHMGGGDFSRGSRGEKGESGAEPLASSTTDVGDVALDGRIERLRLSTDSFFDGVKVGVDQLEGLGERHAVDLLGAGLGGLGCHVLHLKIRRGRRGVVAR